jgi:hypothetical protein
MIRNHSLFRLHVLHTHTHKCTHSASERANDCERLPAACVRKERKIANDSEASPESVRQQSPARHALAGR